MNNGFVDAMILGIMLSYFREIQSQKLGVMINEHRKKQMQELAERKEALKKEEQYYDMLWEQDRQKKIQREEKDKLHLESINRNCMEVLKDQLRSHQLQAEREKALENERAKLLVLFSKLILETRA